MEDPLPLLWVADADQEQRSSRSLQPVAPERETHGLQVRLCHHSRVLGFDRVPCLRRHRYPRLVHADLLSLVHARSLAVSALPCVLGLSVLRVVVHAPCC